MTNLEQLIPLYSRWLALAEQNHSRVGADADEAVSEALGEGMKKPIREKDAARVYFICLKRVRARRIRPCEGARSAFPYHVHASE